MTNDQEREAFEAFVLRGTKPGECFLERYANGDYVLGVAQGGWAAWQARAALQPKVSVELSPGERLARIDTMLDRFERNTADLIAALKEQKP